MMRVMLAVALASVPIPAVQADFTVCKTVKNPPLTHEREDQFGRKPDFAATSPSYPRTLTFDGMPPERMRGPAYILVSTGTVKDCGKAAPGTYFEACSRGAVIHMPNPCDYPDEEFARLLCHEKAHVAWGWPAEHGG